MPHTFKKICFIQNIVFLEKIKINATKIIFIMLYVIIVDSKL